METRRDVRKPRRVWGRPCPRWPTFESADSGPASNLSAAGKLMIYGYRSAKPSRMETRRAVRKPRRVWGRPCPCWLRHSLMLLTLENGLPMAGVSSHKLMVSVCAGAQG